MDGRLWDVVYQEIRHARKPVVCHRAGRPRLYGTDEVLAVWVFAAMMDWPISVAQRKLADDQDVGWWLRRHWGWPQRVPSVPTLVRRASEPDFRQLLRGVLRGLRGLMADRPMELVAMDATPLLTGAYSRDPESRWARSCGKWLRGYALHAVCDERGLLWAWHVTSANVGHMRVARRLVRRLSIVGRGTVKRIVADSGYDSEPLHELIDRRLCARLVAPLNRRGAKSDHRLDKYPRRKAANELLGTRRGKELLIRRSAIERWNGWFKGTSHVSMLPYHARRLHRVRRWIDLKLAVFFAHQFLLQKGSRKVA